MTEPDNKPITIRAKVLIPVLLAAAIIAADIFYLIPRYGGILPYFMEGSAAGSMTGQTEGNRDRLASELEIYFQDSDMKKYPASLEELWSGRNYMTGEVPEESVFVPSSGGKFKRAHWRRDARKIKSFRSRAEADDSGGWGYVGDPDSPEWGTVFVNCTHEHFKRRVPWNMAFEPPQRPKPAEAPAAPSQQSAGS